MHVASCFKLKQKHWVFHAKNRFRPVCYSPELFPLKFCALVLPIFMPIQHFIQVLVVSSVELKIYQTECRLRILTNIVYNQDQIKAWLTSRFKVCPISYPKRFFSWTNDGPLITIVLSKACTLTVSATYTKCLQSAIFKDKSTYVGQCTYMLGCNYVCTCITIIGS